MKRESLKRATMVRFLGAILVLVGLVLLQGVHAEDASRGTWTAQWQADKPDRDEQGDDTGKQVKSGEYRLQLNMNVGRHNNFGNSYPIDTFKGLTLSAVTGAKAPVQFQLSHDAGTITFD